jgi:hypothetical protein
MKLHALDPKPYWTKNGASVYVLAAGWIDGHLRTRTLLQNGKPVDTPELALTDAAERAAVAARYAEALGVDAATLSQGLLELVKETEGQRARQGEGATDDSGYRINAHSLPDLMAVEFPAPRWAVTDLLSPGLSLLAGRPKAGKSTLMLQLGLDVARGALALGKLETEAGDVLLLDCENSEALLQERMRTLVDAGRSTPANFTYVTDEVARLDEGLLDGLRAWAVEHAGARLVVIDGLEGVRPLRDRFNGAAYRADYHALKALADLAKELNLAVVVLHHTRKMAADDPQDLISGTNGLAGVVDSTLVLQQAQSATVLSVRGRRVRAAEWQLVWKDGRWGIAGLPTLARMSEERLRVLQALRLAGGRLTLQQLVTATKMRDAKLSPLLSDMVANGQIVREKRALYALPNANLGEK